MAESPQRTSSASPDKGLDPFTLNDVPTALLAGERQALLEAYRLTREHTLDLARPLGAEDQLLQSMPDASPTKWHLAHTTWFFETFILARHQDGFEWHDRAFRVLYNSYYNGIGEQHPRPRRGMISRPGFEQVRAYRRKVDEAVLELLETCPREALADVAPLVVLGINHEQQHQELIVTDIKHALYQNPTFPAYAERQATEPTNRECSWLPVEGGEYEVGFRGEGFSFDNERPPHRVLLQPFAIASDVVTNADWLEFMDDGGYRKPLLWLSDGWAWLEESGVRAPLYWERDGKDWAHFTLRGLRALDEAAPVCHVSYYEADAFARWRGCRLPTEFEWEAAACEHGFAVGWAATNDPVAREFLRTWEWTASAYAPYPGYRPAPGAVGEYNGKFMVNQMVLRGASSATPGGHSRPTYRNFFAPSARWQYAGLRLARDAADD